MNISGYIPYGQMNAISRHDLAATIGVNERTVREMIKKENIELADKGLAILSSSHSKGYWLSGDKDEMRRYLAENDSRIRRLYKNDAPIRKIVGQLDGQTEINKETA